MEKEYLPFHKYETTERKIEVVKALMQAGHTDKSAGEILRVTRNTIAGFRRDHKIPPRPKPGAEPETGVIPMAETKPVETQQSAIPATKTPRKLEVSEAEQCIELIKIGGSSFRCGLVREAGSPYCLVHQSEISDV